MRPAGVLRQGTHRAGSPQQSGRHGVPAGVHQDGVEGCQLCVCWGPGGGAGRHLLRGVKRDGEAIPRLLAHENGPARRLDVGIDVDVRGVHALFGKVGQVSGTTCAAHGHGGARAGRVDAQRGGRTWGLLI